MPTRPGALILAACLVLPLASAACSLVPAGGHADLAPTLSFQDKPGGPVAFQSGQRAAASGRSRWRLAVRPGTR